MDTFFGLIYCQFFFKKMILIWLKSIFFSNCWLQSSISIIWGGVLCCTNFIKNFFLLSFYFLRIYYNLLAWHACGTTRKPVCGSRPVKRREVGAEIKEAVGPDHVLKALDFTVRELSHLWRVMSRRLHWHCAENKIGDTYSSGGSVRD